LNLGKKEKSFNKDNKKYIKKRNVLKKIQKKLKGKFFGKRQLFHKIGTLQKNNNIVILGRFLL